MKKVFFAIASAFLLVIIISSCTPDAVEEQTKLYGIENEEVKESDI